MGTGITLSVIITRKLLYASKHTQKYIDEYFLSFRILVPITSSLLLNVLWLSPRFISIGQLNTLLYLHLQPINHIVYMESYYLTVWDILS